MSTTLYIPVRNSTPPESVAVPLSALPSDPSDLIGVLTNELAPPSLWLRLALSYFSSHSTNAYLELLSAITADDATAAYNQPEVNNAQYTADRIAILCSLAGYSTYSAYTQHANAPHQRTLLYQQALQHLNAATALDYRHTLIWSCRALLAVCQADISEALSHANEAIKHDKLKTNTLALLVKAICLYHRQRYADAAKHLQAALQSNSELPVGVMLGLALCWYASKDVAGSVRVLRKVLESEPDNVDALAVLAVIEMNEVAEQHKQQLLGAKADNAPSSSSSVTHALSLLVRAYELNPSHPLTLVHLASHLFYMGEYDTTIGLANRALSLLDASHHGLRSDAYFQLARCHHVRHDFTQAAQYYALGKQDDELMQRKQRAIVAAASATAASAQSQPSEAAIVCSHPLLLLGHAQMLLLRGDLNAALPLLVHLHSAHPSDIDVQRLLALTRLQLGQFGSAEPLLAQLLHSSPYDVELLCAHAHACEQIDGKKPQAKTDYIEAVRVIREAEDDASSGSSEQASDAGKRRRVPMQLLNNLAVLCHELGDMEEAKRWYEEALKVVEEEAGVMEETKDATADGGDDSSAKVVPASVTVRYNLALLNERAAPPSTPLADLSAPYLSLISAFPSYTDPYLRLGTLHVSHSAYTTALSFFQQALARQDKHLEGRTLLAQLFVRQGQLREAEKEYLNIALWTVTGKAPEEKGRVTPAADADDDEEEIKGDTYAKLALGNLYLHQARLLSAAVAAHVAASPNTPPPTPAPSSLVVKLTKSKAQKGGLTAAYWQEKAGRYFRSVLASDSSNLYAAHGLGCLLAEQGEYSKAKEVLMAVREASASEGYVDVVMNLGHIHVQQGQYAAAVKCYEDVIAKLLPKQPQRQHDEDAHIADTRTNAYLYLARAYYLWGQMDEALVALDHAVLARPSSALVWYDKALAQEEYAVSVLRKKLEERTLTQVRTAVGRLTEAQNTFSALAEAGKRNKQREEEERRKERERRRTEKEASHADEEKKEEQKEQPDGLTASTAHSDADASSSSAAPSDPAAFTVVRSADGSLVCPAAETLSLAGCLFPLYDKASAHAVYCRQTLDKAAAHLAAAEKRETELGQMSELVKRQREQLAEAQRRDRDEREQREREEREKADAVARENKAKLAALQENWVSERRQEKESDDDDDRRDAAGDGGERRKSKGKGRKKGRRAGSGSDEEAEDEERGGRRRNKRQRAERAEPSEEAEAETEAGDAQLTAEEEEAAADAAVDEKEEWQRLREARARQTGMRDILPAPEHQTREGQEHTTEAPTDDGQERESNSQRRSRRSRIRRAAPETERAEDEEAEERVRGLDEDDEQQRQVDDDTAPTTDEQPTEAVEDEEGREAETEQLVSEAVEMRRPAKRRTILDDEEAEGLQEGAGEGAASNLDEAVEMNVSHIAENEAPIRKQRDDRQDEQRDEARKEEQDAMERQTVSATAMDMND